MQYFFCRLGYLDQHLHILIKISPRKGALNKFFFILSWIVIKCTAAIFTYVNFTAFLIIKELIHVMMPIKYNGKLLVATNESATVVNNHLNYMLLLWDKTVISHTLGPLSFVLFSLNPYHTKNPLLFNLINIMSTLLLL